MAGAVQSGSWSTATLDAGINHVELESTEAMIQQLQLEEAQLMNELQDIRDAFSICNTVRRSASLSPKPQTLYKP